MADGEQVNGLTGFWALAAELQRFWAWIVLASALPFLASLASISPPWPSANAVLTSIVVLLSLLVTYQFFRLSSKNVVNFVIGFGIIVLFASSIFYFAVLSELTFRVPISGETRVKGIVCTNVALQLYAAECPWLGEKQLKVSEWTSENLWTTWSITLVRLTMLVSWLFSFLSLSIVLAAFIIYQVRGTRR